MKLSIIRVGKESQHDTYIVQVLENGTQAILEDVTEDQLMPLQLMLYKTYLLGLNAERGK